MPDIRLTLRRDDDVIQVTILEDGQTRIDVQGEVSFANHGSAEEALGQIEKMLGGQTDIQSHGHAHHHHHHSHTHTHGQK
jgi:hypothetical protein